MASDVEADVLAGRWVPIYYGNRFKVARLRRNRRRDQEERPGVYATLAEAQAAADRLNGRKVKAGRIPF